jgi:hypothetical protein
VPTLQRPRGGSSTRPSSTRTSPGSRPRRRRSSPRWSCSGCPPSSSRPYCCRSSRAPHGGRARAVCRLLLLAPSEQCGTRGRRRVCRRRRGRQVPAPREDEPLRVRRVRRRAHHGADYLGRVPLRGDTGEQGGREEQRHDVIRRRGVPGLGGVARAPPAPAAGAPAPAGTVEEPRRGLPVVRRRRVLLAARLIDKGDLQLHCCAHTTFVSRSEREANGAGSGARRMAIYLLSSLRRRQEDYNRRRLRTRTVNGERTLIPVCAAPSVVSYPFWSL